ncbi:MAG: PP2C family serine/threonine-protein phosphatase [Nitratireductor sp.]
MKFSVAGNSIKGGREYQEDYWLAFDPVSKKIASCAAKKSQTVPGASAGLVVVVADGVGSGGNGDVASRVVANSFAPKIYSGKTGREEAMRQALAAANDELARIKQGSDDYGDMMGTTLIAGYFDDDVLSFLSVGDSSIFRFRDNEMHLVNQHHIYGHDLDCGVSAGRLDWDVVRSDRNRKAITSAVTGVPIDIVQFAQRPIENGDIYILASDGIEVLPHQLIRRLVYEHRDDGAAAIVFALMEMAQNHGVAFKGSEHDNATAVVVVCE